MYVKMTIMFFLDDLILLLLLLLYYFKFILYSDVCKNFLIKLAKSSILLLALFASAFAYLFSTFLRHNQNEPGNTNNLTIFFISTYNPTKKI